MGNQFRADSGNRRKSKRDKSLEDKLDLRPPHDREAELCLLSSIMIMPSVCDDVANIARTSDFFDERNARLYEILVELYNANKAIDEKLLTAKLKQLGEFESMGGMAFLASVAVAAPHAAHAAEYAELIRNNSLRRQLIDAATSILKDAHAGEQDPHALMGLAEEKIFEIHDARDESSITDLNTLLNIAMDRLDAKMKNEFDESTVDTGFTDLDRMLGGLRGSEFIVLAARPSMGKTAFAMNIAENVAIRQEVPVLFVSLEMASVELVDRMLCSLAEVDGHRMRAGTIRPEDNQKLVDKAADISKSPMFVDDSPSRTVTQIAAAARRIKKRTGRLGLIVIDYLQLIDPDNASDPRQEQVAKMARRLKGLARELSVPVLCLVQLNRQAEAAKGSHRPRLSHLRESGAIEQDADVVMFVHREEYYLTGDEAERVAGEADIIIAKQRNGPVGDVRLLWQKQYTRFLTPAHSGHAEIEQFNQAQDSYPEF